MHCVHNANYLCRLEIPARATESNISPPMADDTQFPPSIELHGGLRVVICAEHGSCYVGTNVERHLSEAHHIKSKEKNNLVRHISSVGIASNIEDVVRPEDGLAPIPGLPIHDGFWCTDRSHSCQRHLSTSEPAMKEHERVIHGRKSGSKGRPRNTDARTEEDTACDNGYCGVKLQTLWKQTKYIDYFVVEPVALEKQQPAQTRRGETGQKRKGLLKGLQEKQQRGIRKGELQTAAEELRARYEQVQEERLDRYGEVQKLVHVSELTPWLRATGYQAHIEGLDVEEFQSSYQLPDPEGEPLLSVVCASVARVLRKTMGVLDYDDPENRRLSRLNAKLLNTFRRAEMSQDPIKPLQNEKSKQSYIRTFQKLICYFSRVSSGRFLDRKKMFEPTSEQLEAWERTMDLATEASQAGSTSGKRANRERTEAEREMDERLDGCVLEFSLALIRQRLSGRAFDSAIVSFAAVLAWDTMRNTWMREGDYTGHLSRLIYDCQLLVLQHCLNIIERDAARDLTSCIVEFRDKWMLNDTPGPVGELLSSRLLGSQIAKNTVDEAQVRWHADGETITHKGIQLAMQDVRDLVEHELTMAMTVFKQDLCFDLEDIPSYPVENIVDNWDARSPGASFATDGRNAALFADANRWLFDRLTKSTELMGLVLHKTADGDWRVRSDAAKQYEDAVQKFLEHLMVLIHVGSGQPARRPELLGLRWCNKQADQRNIFIHDGYVMFILTYHKSLNLTNASRFPVRVLLPEVGRLFMRFVLLVQPFRAWLSHDTNIPEQISEYLWTEGKDVWTEDRMTRVFGSRSRIAIGVRLDVRSWRQIAAGIAIKKFAGSGCQFDVESDDEDDVGCQVDGFGGSMPEAFHWQASHTPRVGNRSYGGTVNFRGGLTDAGLQEYLRISRMWHVFLRDQPGQGPHRKHSRQQSDVICQPPLAKRIAIRDCRSRCRRQWSMAEARVVLRQMYGPGAKYRTAKQEEAVQAVVSGLSPVIAVLGTGEGKSLLFMLPQRLPGAGTTVLIVPLVALKQDTVRRCEAIGIECRAWDYKDRYGIGNALMIVSLDQAVSPSFRSFLHGLDAAGQLNSMVFDESHLILTASSYREKMEEVKQFRNLGCQFVFLTATLPKSMVKRFSERLLLSKPVVIRGLTVRKDIQYEVRRSPRGDIIGVAVEAIKIGLEAEWFASERAARGIVYCRTRDQADVIGRELGCPVYYSDSGTEEEKGEVLKRWIEGEARILAATSAFGAGIDYGCVRIVYHVGEPESAVNFAQEVGRGGRDGGGSVSCVILPKNWKAKSRDVSGELLEADVMTMQRFLDSPRCRIVALGEYLDGVVQVCEEEDYACDRCSEVGLLGEEEVKGWSRVEMYGEEDEEGVSRLREFERGEEEKKVEFISNLRVIEGKCVLCILRGDRKGKGHEMAECGRVEKREFFAAKKRARERGDVEGRGWMERFSGCYRCGLSQEICEKQGQDGCRYRDIVMPIGWLAFRIDRWRKEIEGIAGSKLASEDKYMEWLGKRQVVFREEGSNMLIVAIWIVDRIVKEI